MLPKPEPGFEARVSLVEASTEHMWRLSRFPDTEPFYGVSAGYRFDDPRGAAAAATYGVLYVADMPETAFCESIIHGSALYRSGFYEVPAFKAAERTLVGFRHPVRSTLRLVDLTGDALKRLGLTNDISSSDDYAGPQAWSRAIHEAIPKADGIRYVSRQRNSNHCYALFDRCGLIADVRVTLTPGDMLELCNQFAVKLV